VIVNIVILTTMNEEDYKNATELAKVLYDRTGMLIENHPSIVESMEIYARKYHQSKLKLLGLHPVIDCTHSKVLRSTDGLKYCDDCGESFGLGV
ncbi:hypothetical protein J8L88_21920, partial [Aquimarina sp. MMG015]|uniref:hypothetical protein n=1 Tax=Aquimarina sp. MMG015 TaxID=2822689 RepID=UPI001B3A069B